MTALNLFRAEQATPGSLMQDWKSLWRHGRRHPIETVISLLVIALIAWAIWASGSWAVQAADWSVVGSNLPLYLSGGYPASERWRPWLWVSLLTVLTLVTLFRPSKAGRLRWLELALPWCWIGMIPLGLGLLGGGIALRAVPSREWGRPQPHPAPDGLQCSIGSPHRCAARAWAKQ